MFNFKKQTIFTHTEREIDYETSEKGGILAIWGSSGSGKTIISAKLAKYLAEKKQDVVVLFCDMTAPMLPCIINPGELETEKSLGSILAATHITEPLVNYNTANVKRNKHLSLIGLLKGENEYTYSSSYTEEQAEELLNILPQIAPFVIIDCSSYIAGDLLSALALKKADEVLRVASCDLKAVSFLSSQLPLLKSHDFEIDNHYKVVSNAKSNRSAAKIINSFGNNDFKIPHTAEIEEQYLDGNLLADLELKSSRAFREEIRKISKEVFGV